MPIARLRDAELFYDVAGSGGDPAVLIHGSLVDHTAWDRVVPILAQSLTVLEYDRRGYGRSSPGPKERPVETDAADLAALLETLDLLPVHVIAHSYGGPVALRLAAQRPELVRSVSIHEAPLFGLLADQPSTADIGRLFFEGIDQICDLVHRGETMLAARTVVEVFSPVPGAWDRLPASVRSEFAGRMDRWVEEYRDPDSVRPVPSELAEVLLPVLLTSGSQSPPFLGEIRTALARLLPNVTELDVPGAGHAPHVTHPASYAGILLSFLLERNVPSH
jgi:pimeloyl-ACP methyl ester carboxylesterase